MTGCGEDFCEEAWEFLTWYLLMGLAIWGGKIGVLGGETVDGGNWG